MPSFNQAGQVVETQINVGDTVIEIQLMEGTARLIRAPRGTRIVIRDYDHALCKQADAPEEFKSDDNGDAYHEIVLERPGY